MDNRRVKAQEIIRRRRDIEFIEKLVDSEELNESAFDFVLGQIKSVMPYKTDNGLAGMTAENFLSFYQTIQVVVQENLRSNNPLAQNATIHLTRMLEPMTEIFKFVNEEIKNSSSSVIADWQKEVFSEGKKTPIFKFIATDPKFSTSDILLTPERLDKRKKKYLQDYRRAKDPVDSYEIRAQKELLFHMLRH